MIKTNPFNVALATALRERGKSDSVTFIKTLIEKGIIAPASARIKSHLGADYDPYGCGIASSMIVPEIKLVTETNTRHVLVTFKIDETGPRDAAHVVDVQNLHRAAEIADYYKDALKNALDSLQVSHDIGYHIHCVKTGFKRDTDIKEPTVLFNLPEFEEALARQYLRAQAASAQR